MQPTTVVHEPNIDRRLRALRRANIKLIQMELYNYRVSKQMIARALRGLSLVADSTVSPAPLNQDRVQTSRYLYDIVAQRAEELIEERRYTVAVLTETARRLDAIEYMLNQIDEPRRRFVKMKWIGVIEETEEADGRKLKRELRYEEDEIEVALGVSSRTLRRWKREVVEIVAGRLGLLV